ncbi:hypothetical protein TSOC_006418 [Tetrabaena socialis]|uniref:Uncharacterized protein n=1 Tax=Tetrabaena socialis TaxID=47790 RepID=A0A2J8A3U9_9CHLO|nr:hypothetical protein TSOC_006418 [Tetrabaena socialis]|eukprot:PNH07183.1 hypothetical protein TSOC_006418 [Tetrabaena socialis]
MEVGVDSAAAAEQPQLQPKRKRVAPAILAAARAHRPVSCGDFSPPPRRPHARRADRRSRCITLNHGPATTVADGGLQVWRGACLLSDWLLAQPPAGPACLGRTLVLELSGGVGPLKIEKG